MKNTDRDGELGKDLLREEMWSQITSKWNKRDTIKGWVDFYPRSNKIQKMIPNMIAKPQKLKLLGYGQTSYVKLFPFP